MPSYYIHYTHTRGASTFSVTRPNPIRGMDDINDIQGVIERATGREYVAVASWQRFEDEVA